MQVRQFNELVKQGTDIQSLVLSEEELPTSGALDGLIARYAAIFRPIINPAGAPSCHQTSYGPCSILHLSSAT